jgi:anaerobic selenocysteine-containing dehydrogenase
MEHGTLLKHLPVPTMSGRLEFYSYLMAGFVQMYGYQKNWDPGLVYIPPETKDVKLAANEFHFIYGKVPTVSYASTNSNNPLLMALSKVKGGKFLGVWVNRKKGKSLNLKDGDVVVLENAQNPEYSAKAVVFLTEMVRPDTVFISSSFGTKNPLLENAAGMGIPLNNLVPYKVEPFVTGFKSQEFTVRIIK